MLQKRNLKARLFAGALAVVTAASPITTYAAEMQMVESVNLDGEDSITRIETEVGKDEASRFLFIKLNQGGIVVLNKDEKNQQTVKLEEIDKKLCINVYDREGTLLSSEDAEENQYTYLYETEADKVVTVNALPAKGFGVADFESVKSDVKEDTGFTDSIADGEEAAESFAYPVLMDDDTVITVRFKEELKEEATDEEVKDAEDGKTEGTEEVTDAEDKADAAEDKTDAENTEDKAEGTEESADATEPTEGEDATETPEGEEDLLIGQPEESDGEDAEVNEGEDDLLIGQPEDTEAPEGEDDLLIETPENTEGEDAEAPEGEDDLLIEQPEDGETTEGEGATEETPKDAETADGEEDAEEPDDKLVEEGEAAEGEETTEETPEETAKDETADNTVPEEHFIESDEAFAESLKKLDAANFSSGRLVILASDAETIIDPEHQIANYGNIYLMQYKSAEQAMNAYVYYSLYAGAVEPDMPMDAASEVADTPESADTETSKNTEPDIPIEAPVDENATNIEITENVNPIATLAETDTVETPSTGSRVIALIDTGVSECPNVISRVSLIDDVLDSNVHGDEMVKAIVSQNPDAEIISVKAMGNDGKGTVSSIVAGIEYAIEQGADIINLSLYARTNLANTVLASEIQKAIDAGIDVVGAAGNDNADAKDYMPGSVEPAWIIGAANEDGTKYEKSNYGATVDFNVVGTSTSEAAAKFSGYISAHGSGSVEADNKVIFAADYVPEEDENTDISTIEKMFMTNTLQFVIGSEFDPKTDTADIKASIPEGAEFELIYSNVDMDKLGLYATVYMVKTELEEFAIKRPVEVVETISELGKHKVSMVSNIPAGILFSSPRLDYNEGDTVECSFTPVNGVTIKSIDAYMPSDGTGDDLVLGEALPLSWDTAYIPATEDGELNPGGLTNENTVFTSFEMRDTDIIIQVEAVYDDTMQLAADLTQFKLMAKSTYPAYFNSKTCVSGSWPSTTLYSVTYTVKNPTTGKNITMTKPCYCIEPSKDGPLAHETAYTYYTSNGSVQKISNGDLVAKGLYYLYGGPGWNKTFRDSNGQQVNMKTILDEYPSTVWQSGGQWYYALCHFILGYLYNGSYSNWNYGQFTSTGSAWFKKIADQLALLPSPNSSLQNEAGKIVNGKTVLAEDMIDNGDGTFTSPIMNFVGPSSNIATATIPAGITVRYGGKNHVGPTEIKLQGSVNGRNFKVKIDPTVYTKPTYTLTFNTSLPINFEAWKLVNGNSLQDLGFAYYADGGKLSISFEVPEPSDSWRVRIRVRKVDGAGTGLAGAVFGLYYDEACQKPAPDRNSFKLTTKSDGLSNTITIKDLPVDQKEITLYVKELTPPPGFSKIDTVFSHTFTKAEFDALDAADKLKGKLFTVGPVKNDKIITPSVSPPPPSGTPIITPPDDGGGGAGINIIKKSSADFEILDLKSYGLEEAEFMVTSNRGFSAGPFKTDINGNAGPVALPDNSEKIHHPAQWGTHPITGESYLIKEAWDEIKEVTTVYTVTETKPPIGHEISTGSRSVTVTMPRDNGQSFTVTFNDDPIFTSMDLLKVDEKGNILPDVVFKAEYFDSEGPDGAPVKTWYLQSDSTGHVKMDDDHIAVIGEWLGKSDTLFKWKGEAVLPIGGYLQLTEVDAPAEYKVNDTPFGAPTEEGVVWWQGKKFINEIERCSIKIQKFGEDEFTPLPGVEFELTFLKEDIPTTPDKVPHFDRLLDVGESITLHTNQDGELVFDNLAQGTYRLTETRTEPGNTLLAEPITTTIHVPFKMSLEEAVDYGNVDFDTGKEDFNYSHDWYFFNVKFDVINGVQFVMPVTGSNGIWMYGVMGMTTAAVIVTGIIVMETNKKKRRKTKHKKSDDTKI